MAIRQDRSGLTRDGQSRGSGRKPDAPRILPLVIEGWWEWYQQQDSFKKPMSIEDREFRGSFASIRCNRALWYAVNGEPETEPATAADHWRMACGTVAHEILDRHIVPALLRAGWVIVEVERPVDLQPLEINGASTADLVAVYEDPVKKEVVVLELKTKGGFKFKTCVMNWKGGPHGPEYADKVQAVLAAEGIRKQYPDHTIEIRVGYLSLEIISKDLAAKSKLSDEERFMAEWVVDTDEAAEILAYERKRINHILAEPFVPLRVIDDLDDEMPVRRMGVVDIDTGALQANQDGFPVYAKTWRCGYCRWKSRCRADG